MISNVYTSEYIHLPDCCARTDDDGSNRKATKQRQTGSTNLNHASSRSHSILTIKVEVDLGPDVGTAVGKVNLVDLAGSENNKVRLAYSLSLSHSD